MIDASKLPRLLAPTLKMSQVRSENTGTGKREVSASLANVTSTTVVLPTLTANYSADHLRTCQKGVVGRLPKTAPSTLKVGELSYRNA